NSWKPLLAKAALGSAGMEANQLVMSGGQIITTTANVDYQVATGNMTRAEGDKAIHAAWGQAGFNLATAPVVGSFGAWAPATFRAQPLTNWAPNATLTYGGDGVSGQGVTANDPLAVLVNTLSGMGIDAINRPHTRQGDVTAVQDGFRTANGDPVERG